MPGLILSRKELEKIEIGDGIIITIVEIRGAGSRRVKLSVIAPGLPVRRLDPDGVPESEKRKGD